MTIDTRGLSVEHWSRLTAASLTPYGLIPLLATDKDWKTWAHAVCALPDVSALGVPDPRSFSDWKEWGHLLNRQLALLGL